jgi:CCR4-NOT transcriptional regulation complex NOT5 subunit
LDAIKAPTDSDPTDEVELAELTQRLSDRMDHIQQYEMLEGKLVDADEKVARLEQELHQAQVEQIALKGQLDKMSVPGPVGELHEEIERLEETNRRAREVKQYHSLNDSVTSLESEVEQCNAEMTLAQIEKDEAIEAADVPVEGLGLVEDGITIGGIPFSQCSAAQRLKVSMSIAMMANPTVRVILIRDGSLLDEDNMQVIEDMAGDNDFQLWVECVGKDEGTGVYIEDGVVGN